MALLNDFNIWHKFLGPLDCAGTDEEHGHPESEAQSHIAGTHHAEDWNINNGCFIDRNKRNDEKHHENHGEHEHGGDLALGSTCRFGIGIGNSRAVSNRRNGGVSGPGRFKFGGLEASFVLIVHRALIPIQTAAAISAAKTAIHIKSPSTTGPNRPRARPPGLGASCKAMM